MKGKLHGIYIKSVVSYLFRFIYGKPDVPKSSPEIVAEVKAEISDLERDGDWDAAVQLVVRAGDPSARSLPANDWYRIRRKLEIIKVVCDIFCVLTPILYTFLSILHTV